MRICVGILTDKTPQLSILRILIICFLAAYAGAASLNPPSFFDGNLNYLLLKVYKQCPKDQYHFSYEISSSDVKLKISQSGHV